MSYINPSLYVDPALVYKASKNNLRSSKIKTNKGSVSYTCVKKYPVVCEALANIKSAQECFCLRLSCSSHPFLLLACSSSALSRVTVSTVCCAVFLTLLPTHLRNQTSSSRAPLRIQWHSTIPASRKCIIST